MEVIDKLFYSGYEFIIRRFNDYSHLDLQDYCEYLNITDYQKNYITYDGKRL